MDKHSDMTALDDLLAQARPPEPSPDLMARVTADALTLQPVPYRVAARRSVWTRVRGAMAAVGGWQGLGGLVAATCAGVWIGVSPPAVVPDLVGTLWSLDSVQNEDITPELSGFGWDIEDGLG